MSIITQKKKEETRGGKLNIMLARYFEHHLGPTPSGPTPSTKLVQLFRPVLVEKKHCLLLVGIKGSPGVLFVGGFVEV